MLPLRLFSNRCRLWMILLVFGLAAGCEDTLSYLNLLLSFLLVMLSFIYLLGSPFSILTGIGQRHIWAQLVYHSTTNIASSTLSFWSLDRGLCIINCVCLRLLGIGLSSMCRLLLHTRPTWTNIISSSISSLPTLSVIWTRIRSLVGIGGGLGALDIN